MATKIPQGFSRRVPVSKPYLMTRNQALRISSSHFTQFMTKSTIYGVVVDMPMAPNVITTLACYINGAANLYFSNGNDYSGASQRYPGLVQAARAFVTNAANYLSDDNMADSLELPAGRVHYAYLLTTGGIHRIALSPFASNQDPAERVFMNMYQRVMNELRAAQMKDQAAGIDPKKAVIPNPKEEN